MKFSINQSELQNALSVVMKGISTRSTLPVLSGILLEAKDDALILQTTDLQLSTQYKVAALIEEEGKAVIPGKLFSEIIKNLSDVAVHIDANEEQALISCDASSFSLKTLNPDDFPGFPHVDILQRIEIPFNQFSVMVKRVAKLVSKDESRAILTGVLISVENNTLKMVATDSYRLGITEVELSNPVDEFQAVISGNFLTEVASLPKSEQNIQLALAENQIVVTCGDTVLINRRIEGNFPNYRQLLPQSYVTRTKIDVNRLSAAVKRTSLLGSSVSPVKFDINVASQTVQLSAASQDVGSAQETLPCEVEGEDIEIAFNFNYVLDGLSSVNSEKVFLETVSGLKPGIFRAEEENYLYLVMPVRIA